MSLSNVNLDTVAKKFYELLLAEKSNLEITRSGNKTTLKTSNDQSVTIFSARNNLVRSNIAINK